MEILLSILKIIGIIIVIALIAALFIPKTYKIEKEIVINRPQQDVFNYIKFLKNQDTYSKWAMIDPEMSKTYSGSDGTVGFIYAWDSKNKNAGKGEQEIVKMIDRERIDIELRFIKPFEGVGHAHMISESLSEEQTKVKWGMKGKSKYPLNLMNLMMANFLGKDLETSLSNLKNTLEKKPEEIGAL